MRIWRAISFLRINSPLRFSSCHERNMQFFAPANLFLRSTESCYLSQLSLLREDFFAMSANSKYIKEKYLSRNLCEISEKSEPCFSEISLFTIEGI